MKILFIEPYPTEGPSSRYRVEQYIPYFEKNGIRCIVRPFMSPGFYKIIYKKGYVLQKILYFLHSSIRRSFDIFTALGCDIVFIHLEAFPFGPPVFEYILAKMGKKIIYDLDDAIYLGITSPAGSFLRYLKCPSKVREIIKLSDYIITCNAYLADYAKKYNKNVTTIHTSVDTEKFLSRAGEGANGITIGWIGSHSTTRYLAQMEDIFHELGKRHRFTLKIIGAGEHNLKIPNVNILNMPWALKDEIEQFRSLDIGVYPLPDNEWVLGKTGFKTIQYMSVGVPCVVSDVGANRQIVQNGVNGYLAKTNEEWVNKISILIQDSDARKRIGLKGRQTVEENYSVKVSLPKYMDVFRKVRGEIKCL